LPPKINMKNQRLTKPPIVKAGMLIRKSPEKVFEAFVNPEITTKFWFTRSTGRLEIGKHIVWTWEMYNVSAQVIVKEIEPNKRILIEWGDPGEMTEVEWTFTQYENDSTYVSITNTGFKGNGDSVVAQALDSTGGFTTVLDGAKAWLEHGIELNLIEDKFPKGLIEH
jgi:uncharacterized protein YndB with AHSA1/START domain